MSSAPHAYKNARPEDDQSWRLSIQRIMHKLVQTLGQQLGSRSQNSSDDNSSWSHAHRKQEVEIPRYLCFRNPSSGQKENNNLSTHLLDRANREIHRRILQNQNGLCARCARFDFTRLGAQFAIKNNLKGLQRYPEMLIKWDLFQVLGDFDHDVRLLLGEPQFSWRIKEEGRRICQLCDSLASIIPDHISDSKPVEVRMRVSISNQGMGLGEEHCCSKNLQYYNVPILQVRHGAFEREFTIRPFVHNPSCPSEVAEDIPDEEQKHICISRTLLPNTVDFLRLSNWLKFCDEHHHHPINGSCAVPNGTTRLRFIDIRKKCIVQGALELRYAALSYVWGSTKQYTLTKERLQYLQQTNALSDINEKLSLVVKDAIVACKNLGISYLWVDALCIIQDDIEEKHDQIAKMDLIYSSAYVTLVAAEGESGNDGLARVSVPFNHVPRRFSVDRITYDIDEEIGASLSRCKWRTRGWTFQELVLSTRVIFFTQTTALFYCRRGLIAESLHLWNQSPKLLSRWTLPETDLCGYITKWEQQNKQESNLQQVSQRGAYLNIHLPLLNSFLNRTLSHESDSLAAFSGILNAEEALVGTCHWGLPIDFFATALLWDVVEILTDHPTHLNGLGKQRVKASRRANFPSWSWTGWKMKKAIECTVRTHRAFPVAVIHGTLRDKLITLSNLDFEQGGPNIRKYVNTITTGTHQRRRFSMPLLHQLAVPTSQVLVVETSVATIKVSLEPMDMHEFTPLGLGKYQVGGVHDCFVHLNHEWRREQPEALEFMLIAVANESYFRTMIIDRQGEVAYRVALPDGIHWSYWEYSKPEYKVVLLV